MKILNPVTWAKENVAILIGGAVLAIVSWLLTLLHFNIVLGLAIGIAYVAGRWAEVAYKAMTGAPTDTLRR
jgi:hypothetical protein